MEIRQLKYFVEIAKTGSFSEASRTFFLSQSAISQQIKSLEDEIGSALFYRTSHKVRLTESGQTLLPLARQVLNDMSECQDRMADIKGLLSGELNIGLTESMEPYVRLAMAKFMKQHPHVRLNVYYKSIPELIQQLRSSQLDIAFSIPKKGEEDWVDSEPMIKYHLCAIMRDTHPLANRKEIALKDLEYQNLILPELGFRDHNAIEHYLSLKVTKLNVRAVINEKNSILNLLRSTNFISVLSEQSIWGVSHLCAIPIKELSTPVTNYAHQLKGAYHKKSATTFLKIMKEVINQPYLL